ncbi:MAG: phosphoribosylformylglycinamidine cyclo-ligase [Endomicrobiales bacterium]|nr:phosphoribosylformylglycinamidine cyclo-ligase [Endomicrobiales bacterium]
MPLTYAKSGVNVGAGNELVRRIKRKLPKIGGFGGAYPLKGTDRVLVSSTDGVGTKLKLAFLSGIHDTIGIDLVAMNANDIVCCGAKPLFFLDYFACGKLDVKKAEKVISGIKKGCDIAGCLLIGGETAEMPDFYKKGEYDLAGFCVGSVKKGKEINGRKIRPGDVLVGLPSSGPHSNGYSLIRKVFSGKELKKHVKQLLAPTRIYVKEILALLETRDSKLATAVHGIAHITGGSFKDKIGRILPSGCKVVIKKNSWNVPKVFGMIAKAGNVPENEMYGTLNMGIGMVLAVHPAFAKKVKMRLKGSRIIGKIVKGKKGVDII